MRQIGDNGLELLRHVEGVVLSVYLDSVGIPTAGVGHVIRAADGDLKVGDAITTEQADAWLQDDLASAAACVDRHAPNLPTENARDALVSFVFNVGCGAFQNSTLLKLIHAGDFAGAAEQFQNWTRAGNAHPRGLRVRRALERDLFLAPGPLPDGWLGVHDAEFTQET